MHLPEVVALLLAGVGIHRRWGPGKRLWTSRSVQVQQSFIVLQELPICSFSLPPKGKPTTEPGSLGLGPVILSRSTVLVGGPVGVKFRWQVWEYICP